jgi:hypothetical protein
MIKATVLNLNSSDKRSNLMHPQNCLHVCHYIIMHKMPIEFPFTGQLTEEWWENQSNVKFRIYYFIKKCMPNYLLPIHCTPQSKFNTIQWQCMISINFSPLSVYYFHCLHNHMKWIITCQIKCMNWIKKSAEYWFLGPYTVFNQFLLHNLQTKGYTQV